MSQFDLVYNEVVQDILDNGTWDKDQKVRTVWADGSPAHTISLISKQMVFNKDKDKKHEVVIPTTKRLAWKSAIREMLRFYVERTSNVEGLKIWDEWKRPDGTIGKAYGYQLGKYMKAGDESFVNGIGWIGSGTNQVHKLIDGLKNNPASRRHIISLWNIDDLWDMALYPCVWHSQWIVKECKLHGIVGIRSNDLGLGNSFNCFQYYVLQRMLAQVTGWVIGSLTFNINDAHVYERHVEPLKEQLKREPYQAPKLWINQYIKNFDDFTIDDFVLVHPKFSDFEIQEMSREEALANAWYETHPSITMEVAI